MLVTQLGGATAAQLADTAAPPAIHLSGRTLSTAKHTIVIGASGLPEQIVIKPIAHELPLENRAGKQLPDAELARIGRGPQLRAPMRLVAFVAGKAVEAKVTNAARPVLKDGNVTCQSRLTVGPVAATLNAQYEPDGAMFVAINYTGRGEIDSLDWVADLTGPVDMAIAGPVVSDKVEIHNAKRFTLPGGSASEQAKAGEARAPSTLWGNAQADSQEGGPTVPGLLKHLYIGNGDRGFTWLTDGGAGWQIDAKSSVALLESDDAGRVTWRMRFVNRTTKLSGTKDVKFAVLLHPATDRPADARRRTWVEPADDTAAATAPLTVEGREQLKENTAPLRADTAATFEAFGSAAVLAGPAGGRAVSAPQDNAATYPLGLFRYLACTHTGLRARVVPETIRQVRPGGDPAADRIVLGRALLHDIGVDVSTLAHLADAARLLSALDEFGYFKDDVEFIPYWRSGALVRYGEQAEANEAFDVTEEGAQGQTYVSVFRRPFEERGRRGYQAMLVIVNERDQPARERLYLLDSQRLLGGPTASTMAAVVGAYDSTGIPDDSDWNKRKWPGRNGRRKALRDLEDQGGVIDSDAKDQTAEIFGPLFIPPHDFRIVHGYGLAGG